MTQFDAFDKKQWPVGPWTEEPDKETGETAGLSTVILRTDLGHLCGYVAVPLGHPWHGLHYDHEAIEVSVHGGLTYAENAPLPSKWNAGAYALHLCLRDKDAETMTRYPQGDSARRMREQHAHSTSLEEWQDYWRRRAITAEDGPEGCWWLGFDCAHSGDYTPSLRWPVAKEWGTYKDIAYVRAEVARLAEQLAAASALPMTADKFVELVAAQPDDLFGEFQWQTATIKALVAEARRILARAAERKARYD